MIKDSMKFKQEGGLEIESNIPSLPLDDTTKRLAQEVAALGGGTEHRLEAISTIIRIKPSSQTLRQPSNESTALHDEHLQLANHFHKDKNLYLKFTKNNNLLTYQKVTPNNRQITSKEFEIDWIFGVKEGNHEFIGKTMGGIFMEWWKGFNVSIISFGMWGTGKSYSLFEEDEKLIHIPKYTDLTSRILIKLFDHLSYYEALNYSVGISAFEMGLGKGSKVENIIDLLGMPDRKALQEDKELVNIQVKSVDQALKTISIAKSASENWSLNKALELKSKGNVSHLFLRIMLYNNKTKVLSNLHIVDTIGFTPDSYKSKVPGPHENFVSNSNGQFRNIIQELYKQSNISRLQTLPQPIYSKSSKFSKFISPLLAGNCKTYLLGTIAEEAAWEENIKTLEVLQKAKSIYIPISTVRHSDKRQFNLLYYSHFISRNIRGKEMMSSAEHRDSKPDLSYLKIFSEFSPSKTNLKENLRECEALSASIGHIIKNKRAIAQEEEKKLDKPIIKHKVQSSKGSLFHSPERAKSTITLRGRDISKPISDYVGQSSAIRSASFSPTYKITQINMNKDMEKSREHLSRTYAWLNDYNQRKDDVIVTKVKNTNQSMTKFNSRTPPPNKLDQRLKLNSYLKHKYAQDLQPITNSLSTFQTIPKGEPGLELETSHRMEKMKEIKSQITSLIDRIEHESMKINKSYDLSNLNEEYMKDAVKETKGFFERTRLEENRKGYSKDISWSPKVNLISELPSYDHSRLIVSNNEGDKSSEKRKREEKSWEIEDRRGRFNETKEKIDELIGRVERVNIDDGRVDVDIGDSNILTTINKRNTLFTEDEEEKGYLKELKVEIQKNLREVEDSDKRDYSIISKPHEVLNRKEPEIVKISNTLRIPKVEDIGNRGEYYLLKNNYDNLKEIFKEQEVIRKEEEKKGREIRENLEELKAKYEIDTQNYKLDVNALQKKISVLEESTHYSDVLSLYNSQIDKLNSLVSQLRMDIIQLTNSNLNLPSTQINIPSNITPNPLNKNATPSERTYINAITKLKKMVHRLQTDIHLNEKENIEYFKKDKYFKLQQKCLLDAQKKTNIFKMGMERAEVDSQKYKTEFEEERVKKERLEKRLGEVTENLREVEKEEESHCEEINLLKDFVYNVDGAASYKKLGAKNQSEQKISKLLFDLILQLKEKILGSKDKECLCDSIAFEVKSLYIELERKTELQSQILEVVTSLYQKLESSSTNYDQELQNINQRLTQIFIANSLPTCL